MRLLLSLLVLLGVVVNGSGIYHVDFEDIYQVEADNVPVLHQRDFVNIVMRADKRRSILEQPGFVKLSGVKSVDGSHHEFLIKPSMQHAFKVTLVHELP